MKKSILIIAVLLSSVAFQSANAQISLGLSVNIGTPNIAVQPVWGPTGYDHAEYYYMPDIDVFYNIPQRQYIYMDRGRWSFSASLPSRYKNFDLYSGYKVVVNDDRPYRNAQQYRTRYAKYKGRHDQVAIRNSHEQKYFENKGHPEHNKWKGGRGDDKNDKKNGHDNCKRGHNGKG